MADETIVLEETALRAKLSDSQLQVYDLIRLAGHNGITCDEIEVETKLRHQTASARINELAAWFYKEAGKTINYPLIEERGIRRKTRSGRSAVVWVIKGLNDAKARSLSPPERP